MSLSVDSTIRAKEPLSTIASISRLILKSSEISLNPTTVYSLNSSMAPSNSGILDFLSKEQLTTRDLVNGDVSKNSL